MRFIERTLQNGLRVLFIDKEHLQTASIVYITKAGTVHETDGKHGTAILAHRMNVRGTKSISDTHELNVAIEQIGASITSSSSKELTSFQMTAHKDKLSKVIELISDIIQNPIDRASDLKKEKEILLSQLQALKDEPREYTYVAFSKQMYKGTALESIALGEEEDIPNITIADIQALRKQHYSTNQSAIVVCSHFDEETIDSIVKSLDSVFTSSTREVSDHTIRFKKASKHIQFIERDLLQPVFALGTYAPTYTSQDYDTFKLARIILGTGFGGEIARTIRSKLHLAYYAYAFYTPSSYMGIAGGMAGVFSEKLSTAIHEMQNIYKRFVDAAPNDKDLSRAKGFYKGLLIGQNESSADVAQFYAYQLLQRGKTEAFEDLIQRIHETTSGDIQRVIQKYFSNKLYLTVLAKSRPKGISL